MAEPQKTFFDYEQVFIWKKKLPALSPSRRRILDAYTLADEEALKPLLQQATLPDDLEHQAHKTAQDLVIKIREKSQSSSGLDQFLKTYDLSSEEGVILMCVAEALLRVPDKETQDQLIRDKIGSANWQKHVGQSSSLFVNAGTWALMLTGRVLKLHDAENALKRMIAETGEPVIRKAMQSAMKILGEQFVMGRTIKEALKRSQENEFKAYRYSFDMLGEAAKTRDDAEKYFKAYQEAIRIIARNAVSNRLEENPGVSVKLSALDPRYEFAQQENYFEPLYEKLKYLAARAAEANINLCIDAEEADRLDISLDLFEKLYLDPDLREWSGLGLAVQAYQKRAYPVIDWLAELVSRGEEQHKLRRPVMLRLVKGAYWDSEIKRAQERGMPGYPVFTRKASTDVSYIACARKILDYGNSTFFPQFATHNAHTMATLYHLIKASENVSAYEFQRLHGMGEDLYEDFPVPCRVYAPVGSHKELLAYLVRRLLENGANTSFVNRVIDDEADIEQIIANPVHIINEAEPKAHPRIPLPENLYGASRRNSEGFDFTHRDALEKLEKDLTKYASRNIEVYPLTPSYKPRKSDPKKPILCPYQRDMAVGTLTHAQPEHVEKAMEQAQAAWTEWSLLSFSERAGCLEKAADLLEERRTAFYTLAVMEAGKTLPDAVAEVREAVDFLRYYAAEAREKLDKPTPLPGPTGERNLLAYGGKGVFVCISPWNFPLAIFAGQVAAALVAGNCVLAKPADQTPAIGFEMVRLLHEAGVPRDVLHFIPGPGRTIGQAMIEHPGVAGVVFTGSTDTARRINQSLAAKDGPIPVLIAETGGQNACIVDSTALPEQVTNDVLRSAFTSAGQRCSALRVLYVQEDIADTLVEMITGAMETLKVGVPALLETDVGPVIDADAKRDLMDHITSFGKKKKSGSGKVIYQTPVAASVNRFGSFVPPTLIEIGSIDMLDRENFGPVLHIVRYGAKELDQVIDQINSTGYGLTSGIHTRIQEKADYISRRIRAGNVYINRNMIGAIVGSQPFGGMGFSGTGPKAGGPHYLLRMVTEKVISIDTTAAGGNASLMALST